MVDETLVGKTRKRYKYASFYTESEPIVNYMAKLLDPTAGDKILEPCAGDGSFIDGLIVNAENVKQFSVDAYDLNPKAISSLRSKYESYPDVKIHELDTLIDEPVATNYDGIIGNPPYGAWQSTEKRALLKKIYGGYVKETYALFIRKCLSLLKDGGRMVFIVPDTFLSLNMHKELREVMLKTSTLESVTVFPSKFFPGLSFGYSQLCIFSIKKGYTKDNKIKFIRISNKVENLPNLVNDSEARKTADSIDELHQDDILSASNMPILPQSSIKSLSSRSDVATLGEIAKCVTGFYSGDNQRHLKVLTQTTAKDRKYTKLDKAEVYKGHSDRSGLINGIETADCYIPIMKGGQHYFTSNTNWYINWSLAAVQHYKDDSKARFQNSSYYFQEGIGTPMVRSKTKASAFLLENRVFDQSVVGIFPTDSNNLLYLLGLLNSTTYIRLMGEINHTANNSANYIKQIPVIIRHKNITTVKANVSEYIKGKISLEDTVRINNILFEEMYNLS